MPKSGDALHHMDMYATSPIASHIPWITLHINVHLYHQEPYLFTTHTKVGFWHLFTRTNLGGYGIITNA
jgi:hypothetical protein